jgi:putative methanogenesis marker protein 2
VEIDSLVEHVRSYKGVTRKGPIASVAADLIRPARGVMAAHGEDAAAIASGDEVLLLAADGIMQDLVEKDPYWAGYCSVLVNVNDIAAMGGVPIALVDIISCGNERARRAIISGMADASMKFGVPVVGGHLHPDTTYSAVDVAILGKTDREHLILSSGAKPGDDIVYAMDLDGRFTKGLPYSWDTTSHKTPSEVRSRLRTMHRLAPSLTAGKDISNPGALGTLGMLLESSGAGAEVDILRIPRPTGVGTTHWVTAYQGCGFVVTVRPEKSGPVIRSFRRAELDANVCGHVKEGRLFQVRMRSEVRTLFDRSEDTFGCRRPGFRRQSRRT